jgi:hypothetical protein
MNYVGYEIPVGTNLLDIRSSSISGIRQVKSGIRPDTGYQKLPDYPAEYPVHL